MALILGVKKGERFFIDDNPVTLEKVDSNGFIILNNHHKIYRISEEEAVEVAPRVFISSGVSKKNLINGDLPRLVIEAPKEIIILREELYEKSNRAT